MEVNARLAVLEAQRNNDKEFAQELLMEVKALRAEVHTMSTNFTSSKSLVAGFTLGLSLVCVGLIEGGGEVLEHVIGEGGAEKVDPALGDACADTLVKGRTIRAGVTTLGPR